jgi:hypothetical protein
MKKKPESYPNETLNHVLAPYEADETMSRIHTTHSEGTFKRIAPSVPHCDCRDRREIGAMSPVEQDKDGNCALCGNMVFWKPLGRKTTEHGVKMYNHGCRCEVCREKKNAAKQASRQRKKAV